MNGNNNTSTTSNGAQQPSIMNSNNHLPLSSTINFDNSLLGDFGLGESVIKDMKSQQQDTFKLIDFALSANMAWNENENELLGIDNHLALSTSIGGLINQQNHHHQQQHGNNQNHNNHNHAGQNNHSHQNNHGNNHFSMSSNGLSGLGLSQQLMSLQQTNQLQQQQLNSILTHAHPLESYLNKSSDNGQLFSSLLNQSNNNHHINQNNNNNNNNDFSNAAQVPHSPQIINQQQSNMINNNNNNNNNGVYSSVPHSPQIQQLQQAQQQFTLPPINSPSPVSSEPSTPQYEPMNGNHNGSGNNNAIQSLTSAMALRISSQAIQQLQIQQQQLQQQLQQHQLQLQQQSPQLSLMGSGGMINSNNSSNGNIVSGPNSNVPVLEIVNNYQQPFPIYTVKTHVLVPAPVIKVSNYSGDANDLMVVANPEPDDSIIISQPAVTCTDSTYEFKFTDMHVDRKKHDTCSSFKLKFSLLNRRTFQKFTEVLSPAIHLYYHTDLLPAPDIVRLVPNQCYCGQEPDITCYGYYFKKGRTEILYVDFEPEYVSVEHQPHTVKQEQLRMPNQTSFSFVFTPPNRSTSGTYSVSTRYTKNTTKKDKDKNKKATKVGKPYLFIYNDLPESGNIKRVKREAVDHNDRSAFGGDSMDEHSDASPMHGMGVPSPNNATPPSSSPYNSYNYMKCVIHGEVEELEQLFQTTEYINDIKDNQGNTLVMVAAREGREDMVEKLIELGASLDIKNKTGHTILHMACYSGNIDIVESLIDKVDILEKDFVGATGLHIATERGHYRLVKYICDNLEVLVDQKDNRGLNALHYATMDGHQRIVSVLIDYYLFVDEQSIDSQDYTGMSALHWAAALGKVRIAQMLIDAGANVNIIDGDGESPIFKSISTNNKQVTKLLLDNSSDTFILNNHNKTPIELLAEYSDQNKITEIEDEEQVEDEEEQEEKEEEKEELEASLSTTTTTTNLIEPVNSTNNTKLSLGEQTRAELAEQLIQQLAKLNIQKQSNVTPGEPTPYGPPSTTSSAVSKRTVLESFKPTSGEMINWTSRDITVSRFELLINEIEQNIGQEERGKNKQLTSLLQQSYSDKVHEWMASEEELLSTKRQLLDLESELNVKAHEIIRLTDFISSCPVSLGELPPANGNTRTLGLFVLRRDRYYGFHLSDTLVIASNDSMSALQKIYGNNLPNCILANIVYSVKTKSTKPSPLMPTTGTEFYVVDIQSAN